MADPAILEKSDVGGYKHGRVPRELREQQMLDIAEEAFAQLGYDGTSIEEVCRRSGLKRPLFYTYFGGKEGLFLACYRRARSELNERIAAAAETVDFEAPDAYHQTVEAMYRAYLGFLGSAPTKWDMLYGPGTAAATPVADEIAEQRFQTVELLFAVGRRYSSPDVDDDTIRAFAHAVSGSAEQIARWWRRDPKLSLDDLAALGARVSWAGLEQTQRPDR